MTVFITNIIATCRFQENVLLPMCAQDNQEFYPLLETPGKNITLSSTFEKYIKYLYFAAKLDLLQPVEWTVRGSNPGWGGGARFSSPVQTGPGAHPASCTMGTGSLSRG